MHVCRSCDVGPCLGEGLAIALDNIRLYQQIQERDQRKDEFLALLAHELRNPLAPIRNAIEILRLGADDRSTLEWVAGVLDRQGDGAQVEVVHDGAAALEAARSFLPELVLLDIGMPEMDGYEVARRLRTEAGKKPLLLAAVTGYGQLEDRLRSQEAGFDLHLTKPLHPGFLRGILAARART